MNSPQLIGLYSSSPRQGKSSVAGFLAEQYQFKVHSFATPGKQWLVQFLIMFGYSKSEANVYVYERKSEPLLLIPGEPTTRKLMVTLFTEWGRKLIHPDLWVEPWEAARPKQSRVVADDVRFPNEYAKVREKGGQVWRVIMPGAKPADPNDETEGRLDGFEFDRVICNNSTLLDLKWQICLIGIQ